jgi:hypothetical protein
MSPNRPVRIRCPIQSGCPIRIQCLMPRVRLMRIHCPARMRCPMTRALEKRGQVAGLSVQSPRPNSIRRQIVSQPLWISRTGLPRYVHPAAGSAAVFVSIPNPVVGYRSHGFPTYRSDAPGVVGDRQARQQCFEKTCCVAATLNFAHLSCR